MRILFLFCALFFLCFARVYPASAQAATQPECPALRTFLNFRRTAKAGKLILEELTLTGLKRTSEEFVRDEIGLGVGCEITLADAEAAAQRLRNTNFFLSVQLYHEQISERGIRLHFVFEEKWTLTPVLRGGTGGGVSFFVLGLYDINALGAGIESGAQYEQYAGSPGFVVWWRDPHIGTRDWRLSLEFARVTRPAYFLNSEDNEFYKPLQRSTRFSAIGFRRFGRWDVGLGLEPMHRNLEATELKAPSFYPGFTSDPGTTLGLKAILRYNDVNLDDFRLQGWRSDWSLDWLAPLRQPLSSNPLLRLTTQNLFFKNLGERQNLGLRLQGGWVSGGRLLDLFRLGSLDGVRGLLDGERAGRVVWMVNSEYRYATYLSPWLAVQNVVFADTGNSGVDFNRWPTHAALSVGTGVRIGFRPIARLRVRADYAHGLRNMLQKHNVVVGMQQYF
jgi:outer membrane protein assembly factor BamA